MAQTEAQKKAQAKYRQSKKGKYSNYKNTALGFIRNTATLEDLELIRQEADKAIKTKKECQIKNNGGAK